VTFRGEGIAGFLSGVGWRGWFVGGGRAGHSAYQKKKATIGICKAQGQKKEGETGQ